MNLSIGIVGLPNVGKSTLFNALLKKTVALAANYPFATIEPNVGVVEVPDERLPVFAKIVKTEKIVPAIVEFYDIAGLVKGASTGEGLGNKFLAHIREVAAICHVVRLFEDSNVVHVSPTLDPLSDIEVIETELMMADLGTLDKQKEPRGNEDKELHRQWEVIKKVRESINKGIPVRKLELNAEEKKLIKPLSLLTTKPVIFLFNVSENQLSEREKTLHSIRSLLTKRGENENAGLYFCAKLENEVLSLSESEQKEYLAQYQLNETGLNRLIQKAYEIFGLISFLTAGEIEVRAWTITKGTLAAQ